MTDQADLTLVQKAALDWLVLIPRPQTFKPSVRTLRSLVALGYAAYSESGFRITNAGRRKWNEFNQGSSGL